MNKFSILSQTKKPSSGVKNTTAQKFFQVDENIEKNCC